MGEEPDAAPAQYVKHVLTAEHDHRKADHRCQDSHQDHHHRVVLVGSCHGAPRHGNYRCMSARKGVTRQSFARMTSGYDGTRSSDEHLHGGACGGREDASCRWGKRHLAFSDNSASAYLVDSGVIGVVQQFLRGCPSPTPWYKFY